LLIIWAIARFLLIDNIKDVDALIYTCTELATTYILNNSLVEEKAVFRKYKHL